jgi:hypothetical protein
MQAFDTYGMRPPRDRRSSLLDGDELAPTPISAFQKLYYAV